MNDVVAIVVTYNRLKMLKKCIFALQSQNYSCDILVVDNASNDGTKEWIVSNFSNGELIYFNTEKNIGGAGGFNYGIKKAIDLDYKYVWLMDDDCIVNNDSLEKLMNADKMLGGPQNYGYLSSVVLWIDGTECKMNRQKYKNNIVIISNCGTNNVVKVDQSTFVSILIPAITIRKVGLPIKEFFIWGDDIEYTRRITIRNKIPSYMINDSFVVHEMKCNNGSNIALDDIDRIDRYKYAFRNECYLYRKEGIKGMVYYLLKWFLNFFRVLFTRNDKKTKRLKVMVYGIFEGIIFNPRIEVLDR